MSRKKPFAYDPLSQNPSTLQKTDSMIYGDEVDIAIPQIDKRMATPISIFEINADPAQPRRAIPSSIRQDWDGDVRLVPNLLKEWINFAEAQMGDTIDIRSYIQSHLDGDEDSRELHPNVDKFFALLTLARSIYSEGLTNPITIVSLSPKVYRVETGERRWLAYHLLNMYTDDDEKWSKIPAIVVSGDRSVWRQAIENNQREDLTAIELARQVALLLMDVHREQGVTFAPFSDFTHERDFYAQVADGVKWRIPRGMGERILVAMGLPNKVQLSRYRDILNLSYEQWDFADENAIPEFRIREMLSADKLPTGNLSSPTPPSKTPYMEQFWAFYDRIAKKNTQIAGRVGEAERRQMADALRKLADDLEKNRK